jgi:hypothetical protein
MLKIHTQYFENYNVNADGFNLEGSKQPYWKPKGGHTFVIEDFETDYLLYDESATVEVLKKLVASKSSVAEKFEYIEHELEFGQATHLSNSEFKSFYAETNA